MFTIATCPLASIFWGEIKSVQLFIQIINDVPAASNSSKTAMPDRYRFFKINKGNSKVAASTATTNPIDCRESILSTENNVVYFELKVPATV